MLVVNRYALWQRDHLAQLHKRVTQVRQGHGFHEELLKARLHRRLDFFHPAHQGLYVTARALVQKCDARTRACGVAGRADFAEHAVGNHAQHHGVFHVDMAAKGASQANAVHGLHAHALHQEAHPGVERGLAQLDGAHVVLHDFEWGRVRRGAVQLIRKSASIGLDARVARTQVAVDHTVMANDTGQVHLRQCLNNSRATHAGYAGGRHGGVKTGVVGPQV